MRKAALHNLGCKVNSYETEAMTQLLKKAGYEIVSFQDQADVYIINTCSVTNMADRKSRQMLHRAKKKNPEGIIVAVGCYVQAAKEQLEEDTMIDLVIGNNMKSQVVQIVEQYIRDNRQTEDRDAYVTDIAHDHEYEAMHIETVSEHTRAYIKIQDGCNQFCSYCIIPYARGRVRSKPPEELTEELRQLAAKGYAEVVLAGINLTAYGQEWGGSLCDAVEAACAVPGIRRVRLGSLEPDMLDEAAVDRLAAQEKLCPQFHVALQSGCDDTLHRMNRRYTSEDYRRVCRLLREKFPGCALTTDVMVGFPGESEEDFARSLAFVEEIGFSKVHVFAYSPRPGTPAAKMPGQVDRAEKNRRSRQLSEAAGRSRKKWMADQIGRTAEVLLETRREGEELEGFTPDYLPVKAAVENGRPGQTVQVRLVEVEGDFVRGVPEDSMEKEPVADAVKDENITV